MFLQCSTLQIGRWCGAELCPALAQGRVWLSYSPAFELCWLTLKVLGPQHCFLPPIASCFWCEAKHQPHITEHQAAALEKETLAWDVPLVSSAVLSSPTGWPTARYLGCAKGIAAGDFGTRERPCCAVWVEQYLLVWTFPITVSPLSVCSEMSRSVIFPFKPARMLVG